MSIEHRPEKVANAKESDIAFSFKNKYVSCGCENSLVFKITNTASNVTLALKNDEGRTAEQMEEWETEDGATPQFAVYLWFGYGENQGHLCTEDDYPEIRVNAPSELWHAAQKPSKSHKYEWVLTPRRAMLLAPGEGIAIEIENIHCNSAPGDTLLHVGILWENPSFQRGVEIKKLAVPQIEYFRLHKPEYRLRGPVSFEWNVLNGDSGATTLANHPVDAKGTFETIADGSMTEYLLQHRNHAGAKATAIVKLAFEPHITFTGKQEDRYVELDNQKHQLVESVFILTWNAVNLQGVQILGIGPIKDAGELTIYAKELKQSYVLEGFDAGMHRVQKTVSFPNYSLPVAAIEHEQKYVPNVMQHTYSWKVTGAKECGLLVTSQNLMKSTVTWTPSKNVPKVGFEGECAFSQSLEPPQPFTGRSHCLVVISNENIALKYDFDG